ncbi:hypothetical protein EDB80DRAFT_838185 [Ilyonectria destructans]|nr:hypothetical protein EDB80DRAFT_838185 [Ilyonectria destructans]
MTQRFIVGGGDSWDTTPTQFMVRLRNFGIAADGNQAMPGSVSWDKETAIYKGIRPIQPSTPGGPPGYVMTQIDTWSLTGYSESFRKGAAAYRNGRDWAKEKRDEAIERANKMAREEVDDLGLSFASEASAANTEPTSQDTITHHESNRTPSLYDSDTSADPIDVVPIDKRHRAFGDASSASRASQSDSREEVAFSGSPLKRLVTNLDTGDDEQSEPDHASEKQK